MARININIRTHIEKVLPCTCDEIYKTRGLTAPGCPFCNYGGEVTNLIFKLLYSHGKSKRDVFRRKVIESFRKWLDNPETEITGVERFWEDKARLLLQEIDSLKKRRIS